MGLIKSGIYAGTAYAIFNKASKAYGQNQQNQHQSQQSQPQQMQFQQPSNQRSVSPAVDNSHYVHAHFCNGQCQDQCNPNANVNTRAYVSGSAPEYYQGGYEQQRRVEQDQDQQPQFDGKINHSQFADVASMAQQFMSSKSKR